jgi:hypothetical protein
VTRREELISENNSPLNQRAKKALESLKAEADPYYLDWAPD